jgi:hypothetical protein
MKPLFSSRIVATTLALLTAIALSSCGSKQESASNTSTTPPTDTTAPSTSKPAVKSAQGVAPQGVNCPSANPIKGVTSKRLGKIALTAKSSEYKTAKADKCFADTAAAKQAGYAVPK